MAGTADTVLKLSLAAAALLAGGGVGFYYGIYLPSQDVRRQTEAMTQKQAEAEARTHELAEQAKREKAAQVAYDDCLSSADLTYKSHWTSACRAQSAADQAAFADCADDLFASEERCRQRFPIRPERDCALSSSMADRLTEERDTAQRQCLGQLQAARGT